MIKHFAYSIFCLLIFQSIACKSKKETVQMQFGVVQEKLMETHWELIELEGKPFAKKESPNAIPFLEIDSLGQVVANDGCNRLTGSAQIGKDGSIQFGPMTSSFKACFGQTFETPFRNALKNCDHYIITGGILNLMQGKKNSLARFDAVGSAN